MPDSMNDAVENVEDIDRTVVDALLASITPIGVDVDEVDLYAAELLAQSLSSSAHL